MFKQIAQFEAEIEGKVGKFLLDNDCSIEHAKEMCFRFLKYLGQIEDQVKAQQQKQNAEANKIEEPPKVDNGDQQ